VVPAQTALQPQGRSKVAIAGFMVVVRHLGLSSGAQYSKGDGTLTPWCRFLVPTKVGVDFSAALRMSFNLLSTTEQYYKI
jgi:hypothetical protein